MKITWKKLPSIIAGGKPHYWNGSTETCRNNSQIAWNREAKQWSLHINGKFHGYFDTARESQIRAENL